MEEKKQPEKNESRFPDGFRILQGKQEYITYREHSSIRIWVSDVASHYDLHSHSAVEVIMPHRGESIYRLRDQVYRVQPDEVLIIPPNCPHALTEGPQTLRYLILFEPNPLLSLRDISNIGEMLKEPIFLREGDELLGDISDLLSQMVTCYFQKDPMWNTRCYAYILQVCALLGQRYLRRIMAEPADSHVNIDPAIMNSAMTFIGEHYMENISLERVALFAGFSKCYFSRVFKQFAGETFSEYLTSKRLNAAMDLLINTRQPIRKICMSTGFGSMATFNRVFRQNKNCTPTQFRSIYGILKPNENPNLLR